MKIICIGRNYGEHARELNNPLPEQPVIFMKPDSSLVRENKDVYYPEFTRNLHFECEVVVRIGKEGRHIQAPFALGYIDGVGLGIDLTARDLQDELKEKRLPWTLAKGFDGAAPVSEFIALEDLPDLQDLHFRCDINGQTRQDGHTRDMLFPIGQILGFVSRYITLKKGDLIFTGTPQGVGPLQIGDRIEGYLEGRKLLDFHVR
jgi:2-keto-4-pentenoate hydratase/2-oxohepta-3-ene-1,7-dioic acid hydratase in catechol pathway